MGQASGSTANAGVRPTVLIMRILFFGTAAFAVPSLEQLVGHGHSILLCVTQPERPQGRGLTRLPSPVKSAALRLRLPVEEPDDLQAILRRFQQLQPEVGVVISYGQLIPPNLLTLPVHGMLGVHPSLLPKYRGASPIAWALLKGEHTTGVTVFRLNEQLDAGEILLQRPVPIAPQATSETLSQHLAALGAALLLETLSALERGTLPSSAQDERQATYAPKLTKASGRIHWQTSAASIDRLVRAMIPWPGAYTDWQGQSLKLWMTSYDTQNHTKHGRAGEVLAVSPDQLGVATGEGKLLIHELQLAGRRRMTVREFLAGHDLRVGEVLGKERRNQ